MNQFPLPDRFERINLSDNTAICTIDQGYDTDTDDFSVEKVESMTLVRDLTTSQLWVKAVYGPGVVTFVNWNTVISFVAAGESL